VGNVVKPYYEDDLVQLFYSDCRKVTEWLMADVLVTDPPYGIGYVSNHSIAKRSIPIQGDLDTSLRDTALSSWGLNKPALVFGRWDVARPAGTHMRLVWDKKLLGTGDLRKPWGCSDEEIYLLGDWPPVIPGGRAREGGMPTRSFSVIRVQALAPGSSARPNHPTPKPVPLMEQLVAKCPPGVIADPFAGSGPTLIAAKLLGRPAIGVEIEERYCELIARRLDQGVLPFGEAS
jgi:hypothetical protein